MSENESRHKYTKNDFYILVLLLRKKAKSEMLAMSIIHLAKDAKLSSTKVRGTISLFLEEGYIVEGLPNRCAKTYYITPKGEEKVKEIMGGTI